MLHGVFVTGTDTGVGKTVVSAALMHRYRSTASLRYWKPVQTGIERDDDTREVQRLGGCRPNELFTEGVRLRRAVSPHLASRLAGEPIDLGAVTSMVARKGTGAERWVVEGAGGLLVPLNDISLMVDLIRRLALPVVVVARTRLGTINHTLLTLEALLSRSMSVAGIVLVGPANHENRAAIEKYGGVRVLGELPRLKPLTPAAVKRWAATSLDPEGYLLDLFR